MQNLKPIPPAWNPKPRASLNILKSSSLSLWTQVEIIDSRTTQFFFQIWDIHDENLIPRFIQLQTLRTPVKDIPISKAAEDCVSSEHEQELRQADNIGQTVVKLASKQTPS